MWRTAPSNGNKTLDRARIKLKIVAETLPRGIPVEVRINVDGPIEALAP